MIMEIKVELISGGNAQESWAGYIELDSENTLDDLHQAIQHAVDFDNDHLYEFYIASSTHSRHRKATFYSSMFPELIAESKEGGETESTTIESVFPLEKGQHLYYVFDFGSSWTFKTSRTRRKTFSPQQNASYPVLTKENGTKPIQYEDEFDSESPL